jgi:formylglycine-generating enzyme required for sulfatase activity
MALVGRTCVDKWEAFLLEPGPTGELQPHPFNERLVAGVRYVATAAAGHKPQGYISRVESQAACEAAGKRLCSRREWLAACRGPGGSRWPYGHTGEKGRCNTGKLHLLTLEFPNPPGGIKYEEHFNSPLLNGKPGWLAPSGEYDRCAGDKGVFDMVGNLHEWVKDTVDADVVYAMAEEDFHRNDQPWQTGNGMFLGGFYSTTTEHGPGCEFMTIAHEPTYHDYSTGFRCCRDAARPPGAPRPAKGKK